MFARFHGIHRHVGTCFHPATLDLRVRVRVRVRARVKASIHSTEIAELVAPVFIQPPSI